MIAAEVFRADRPWRATVLAARLEIASRLRHVLREAVGGQLGHEQITETSATAFFGALMGAALDWQLSCPEKPVEAVLDQLVVPAALLGRPASTGT